jgi:outer membrane scaffolding protein for murein synthesis (MipA/OmpV family)
MDYINFWKDNIKMKITIQPQPIHTKTGRNQMRTITSVTIAVIILIMTKTLSAQDSNWEFQLGGGICSENVYLGSDNYYVTPLPNFKASYTGGRFSYSISILEGLSIHYMKPILGFYTSINFNVGETRNTEEYSVAGVAVKHNTRTRDLLEGTLNTETQLALDVMMIYPSRIGLFGLSMAYHPTKVGFDQENVKETTRDGYVYSAMYMIELPASDRMSVGALISIGLMDRGYADTWYSVEKETSSLETFQADAGLRSTMFAAEIKYKLSGNVHFSLIGAGTMLMGDAKDSPFTREAAQGKLVMQTLYHF